MKRRLPSITRPPSLASRRCCGCAGSVGRCIEKVPAAGWEVVDRYGLLVELDKARDFLKAARKTKSLRIAYIVTDDERRFQALARRLPEGVEAIRLYESYLTNFAFANGDNSVKFTLKDYQDEAVIDVLDRLKKARKRWREDSDRHAFSLTAATGGGQNGDGGRCV